MSSASRKGAALFNSEFRRQASIISGTVMKKGPTVLTVRNPKGVTLKYDPSKYTVEASEGEVRVVPKTA